MTTTENSTRIQAIATVCRALRDECKAQNGRARERTLDDGDCMATVLEAVRDGRSQRNGGRVTANSYGYRWSSTVCAAVVVDGHVVADVRRAQNASHGWMEHPRHKEQTNAARALAWAAPLLASGADVCEPVETFAGVSLSPCLETDAFALIQDAGHYERYDYDGQLVGVAVRLPADLAALPGFGRWEHGETLEDCEREIAHKRAVHAAEIRAKRRSLRDERRARLLARISCVLRATYADARAIGYCDAGIKSWCTVRGVDPESSVLVRDLARDQDERAQRVALAVSRRAIAAAV